MYVQSAQKKPHKGLDTEISEFGDRIGIVLYAYNSANEILVMMEHVTEPADVNRCWKLPTGELTNPKLGHGFNGRVFLSEKFHLESDQHIDYWLEQLEPTIEPLSDREAHRKGFRKVRTRWASFYVKTDIRDLPSQMPPHTWVPVREVTQICQIFKIGIYSTVLENVLFELPEFR